MILTHPWQSDIRFLGGSRDTEQALIDRYVNEIRSVAETYRPDGGKVLRAQHAKMLGGFSNAVFRISDDLPEDLRIGFLAPGVEYAASIRFSNASSTIVASDDQPDLRGAALRINVFEQRGIDFLMTNANQHHARDAEEAMATTVAFAVTGPLRKLRGIVRLARRVGISNALRIVKTLKAQMAIPVESMSTETFYSRSPIAIGSEAVKYRLAPTVRKSDAPTAEADLTSELSQRLTASDVSFDFQVQSYVNTERTPIEDSTVAWDAPFFTIARLIIPKGSKTDPSLERQAFNPWNVPSDDFTPLGSMNRARLRVYEASATFRDAAE